MTHIKIISENIEEEHKCCAILSNNSFGTRLAELRKQAGLSQEEFAELLEVSRQSILKWENDRAYPEMARLIFMSDYFKISLDELMRGKHISETETQVKGKNNIKLKTGSLLQEWSSFLSNLSDSQKIKFTLLYIVVLLILCGILCGVFYVLGKNIGEAVYYITH